MSAKTDLHFHGRTHLCQSIADYSVRDIARNLPGSQQRGRPLRVGLTSLLEPKPTISPPNAFRTRFTLRHPFPDLRAQPSITKFRCDAWGCRLGPGGWYEGVNYILADSECASPEEKTKDGDDGGELVEDGE